MHELREMLCEELDKITRKGELSAGSLDIIDKLTHSIKSIDTIMAMEDSGYSRGDMSYASNPRYNNYDRYSRGNDYSYRSNRKGYSRDEEMDNIKENLHEMLESAKSEEERKMIRRWIKQVD